MLMFQMPAPTRQPFGEGAPGYARVFGLTLGANSMRGLERALGEGIVHKNEPSEAAREWRRKGTFIWADGSRRFGEYFAWERLKIDGWEGRLDALPHWQPWTGTLAALKNGMPVAIVLGYVGKGWSIDRNGALTRRDRRRVLTRIGPKTIDYRVALGFEEGALKTISLDSETTE